MRLSGIKIECKAFILNAFPKNEKYRISLERLPTERIHTTKTDKNRQSKIQNRSDVTGLRVEYQKRSNSLLTNPAGSMIIELSKIVKVKNKLWKGGMSDGKTGRCY
jgi:hypothetical protein